MLGIDCFSLTLDGYFNPTLIFSKFTYNSNRKIFRLFHYSYG